MESRTKWDTSIMTGDSIHNSETPDSQCLPIDISLCTLIPYVVTVYFGNSLQCMYTQLYGVFILFILSNCTTLHFQCHKSHLQYQMPSFKHFFFLNFEWILHATISTAMRMHNVLWYYWFMTTNQTVLKFYM